MELSHHKQLSETGTLRPVFRSKIPGKVMLCGEYSVLWGEPCIATAVDCFLDFELTESVYAQEQSTVEVSSDLWNEPRLVSSNYESKDPLTQTVKAVLKKIPSIKSWTLKVSGSMKVNFGVGSSSAIRIGTMKAFNDALDMGWSDFAIFKEALLLQRLSQTRASGYDFATQLMGGFIEYRIFNEASLNRDSLKLDDFCQRIDLNLTSLHSFFMTHTQGAPTEKTMNSNRKWLAEPQNRKLWDKSNRLTYQSLKNLDINSPDSYSNLISTIEAFRQVQMGTPAFPSELKQIQTQLNVGKDWSFKTTGAGGLDSIWVILHPDTYEKKLAVGIDLKEQIVELFLEFGFTQAPFTFFQPNCRPKI